MNLADIDLNLLVAFDAILKEGTVSGASRRLGLGQPATSAALARLRILFRDELFTRVGNSMRPTEKARALATGIDEALSRLRETLGDTLPFDPAVMKREFIIASGDYTTLVLLPPLLAHVRKAAPHVDLRLVGYEKDEAGPLLDRGEVDLALGVFGSPPERTVPTILFEERFVGIARRDHPALASGGLTPETFAALPHALVSLRRDSSGALDAAFWKLGLKRRIALVLPHMLVLPELLVDTDLVAALPARVAARLEGDRLRRFDIPLPLPDWRVSMLWNPTARTDAATGWLRRAIATVAAGV